MDQESKQLFLLRFGEYPVYPGGGTYHLHLTPEFNNKNPLYSINFPLPSDYRAIPCLLLLPPDPHPYKTQNQFPFQESTSPDRSSSLSSPEIPPMYPHTPEDILADLEKELDSPVLINGSVEDIQKLLS